MGSLFYHQILSLVGDFRWRRCASFHWFYLRPHWPFPGIASQGIERNSRLTASALGGLAVKIFATLKYSGATASEH